MEDVAGVFWLPGSTVAASGDKLIDKKLKIGVPIKNGFNEFMKVEKTTDDRTIVSGFPVDVFDAVMALLPYNISYEFIPYEVNTSPPAIYDSSGYYDSLISKVYTKVSNDSLISMTHWFHCAIIGWSTPIAGAFERSKSSVWSIFK